MEILTAYDHFVEADDLLGAVGVFLELAVHHGHLRERQVSDEQLHRGVVEHRDVVARHLLGAVVESEVARVPALRLRVVRVQGAVDAQWRPLLQDDVAPRRCHYVQKQQTLIFEFNHPDLIKNKNI